MSSTNGSNSTASNRTSIFETFNSSTFDADADDFVVINHNVKPVKSVVRRSFDHAPDPAPDVEGFEENLGQETDDVECIEEEEENQHDMLFMSCSPGRISTDDDENDGQLIFTKEAPKKKKKKPTVAKQVERPKSQKQTKHSVKEPKKRQKRQEEESEEEEVMEEPDDEEWTQEKYDLKKQRRRQQRKEEEEEEEEEESVQHHTVKESKKQKPKQDDQQEDLKEPQKALSAYALFYRDTQSAIKSQNAKATFGEVSKIVAKMWDNLDQGHKKVYEKQAEEDKETYLQDMVQYRQACRAQQKNLEAQKKDKTAHLRPYVAHHKPSWSKSSLDADNEENSWSSHESGDRSAEVIVKKSVLALCNRSNCPNRAIEDPRWNKDYCSTECVISHCRDVFTAWVSSRHSIYKSDKSDT